MSSGASGSPRTDARVFANAYRDTETYLPDLAALGRVNDAGRFSSPDAKPFVPYLLSSLFAVATGQQDHLSSRELIEAVPVTVPPFNVCARPAFPAAASRS